MYYKTSARWIHIYVTQTLICNNKVASYLWKGIKENAYIYEIYYVLS